MKCAHLSAQMEAAGVHWMISVFRVGTSALADSVLVGVKC